MNCDISDFDRFLSSFLYKMEINSQLPFFLQDEKEKYKRITISKNSPDGPVLWKNDTYFDIVIEPWVKRLVYFLIYKLHIITYCSCEGHRHLSKPSNIDERYVKMLFLNQKTRDNIYKIFEHIISTIDKESMKEVGIELFPFNEWYSGELLSQNEVYCLQIWFPTKVESPSLYFDSLEKVYNRFVDELEDFFQKLWKQ